MDDITPGELLTRQHRKIDAGIQGLIDGSGGRAKLAESLALLRLHLYVEEELLFQPLAKSGLTMPVFVMKREHGEMWPLLENLDAGCGSAAPLETLHGPAKELFQLLQIHNPKEEQIVYAAVDKLSREKTGGPLVEALESATVPDDWTCEMAPH
ncbi:MAG: hemerythrin domain-containing protein [Gammaproteobacteria bacterium]|nr:hemerythrin domain-containing protein [Gammaproteobacteria bacterium]